MIPNSPLGHSASRSYFRFTETAHAGLGCVNMSYRGEKERGWDGRGGGKEREGKERRKKRRRGHIFRKKKAKEKQ